MCMDVGGEHLKKNCRKILKAFLKRAKLKSLYLPNIPRTLLIVIFCPKEGRGFEVKRHAN